MADRSTTMTGGPALGAGPLLGRKGIGRKADPLFALLTAAAGSTVLVILGFMILTTTMTALPAFKSQGISFITSTNWDPSAGRFGILAFIYGTLVTSAIAVVLAVPLSLGVALYVTEAAPRRLREPDHLPGRPARRGAQRDLWPVGRLRVPAPVPAAGGRRFCADFSVSCPSSPVRRRVSRTSGRGWCSPS